MIIDFFAAIITIVIIGFMLAPILLAIYLWIKT